MTRCRIALFLLFVAGNLEEGFAKEKAALLLKSDHLHLAFDRHVGCLVELTNKLTGEVYQIRGDGFSQCGFGFILSRR